MCWSGEASSVLAAIGIGSAAYAAKTKAHPTLWVTLAYFSLMELLQAFTYSVIDNCNSSANQISTLFGYLHITFQPFFVNAISMYFLPAEKRNKIAIPVYTVCFIASIIMILQIFPFSWAGLCHLGQPMCARELCSVHGNWHIAWNVPLNGMGFTVDTMFGTYHVGAYFAAYFLSSFFMPLLYGVYRGSIFHLLCGPVLAWLTTDNMNEWPAIWCLLSIGIVLMIVKIRADPVLCEKYLRIKPTIDSKGVAIAPSTRKEANVPLLPAEKMV